MLIDQAVTLGEKCEISFAVRITRIEHGYLIHTTAESNEIPLEHWNKCSITGIDMSPEGIGVPIMSPYGNLVKKFLRAPRLLTV